MLESESMLKCFAFSDWRMLAVSIVRNDRLASNFMQLCSAACLAPCCNSSPGDFFGVLVLFREVCFYNQLVPFWCYLRCYCCLSDWLLPFLIHDGHTFTLSGVHLMFFLDDDGMDSVVFSCLASSKQNFLIFSWFLLYSPTVLHAIICMGRGFCSIIYGLGSAFFLVTVSKSFFLITVFFINGVSIVIVCGEYPVIVPSSILFHCGASVCRGSLDFLASDFFATFLRVLMYFVVLSPSEKCNSDG